MFLFWFISVTNPMGHLLDLVVWVRIQKATILAVVQTPVDMEQMKEPPQRSEVFLKQTVLEEW
jgi:hypothetical protein